MVAIKNVLLFVAAATAAVLPRDAAQALSDLQTIDADTNKLTSAVQNWSGSLFTATSISSAESALESDIKAATANNKGGAVASSADSKKIIAYIQNTLEPDIEKSIQALEAKKTQFENAGLGSTVLNDLKNLKSETDSFSAELVQQASSDQQSNAKAAAAKIDSDFNSAIAYFS